VLTAETLALHVAKCPKLMSSAFKHSCLECMIADTNLQSYWSRGKTKCEQLTNERRRTLSSLQPRSQAHLYRSSSSENY
jgi:hypothetical protein